MLSGGSTLFEGLPLRIENEIQRKVNLRLNAFKMQSGKEPTPIKVNVAQNPFKRVSVW